MLEIELVSETTAEELQAAEGDKPVLTKGVTVAYTKPASSPVGFLAYRIRLFQRLAIIMHVNCKTLWHSSNVDKLVASSDLKIFTKCLLWGQATNL